MEISQQAFAALCYLVLMDHHRGGYRNAHPSYIEEKLHMLRSGYEAYLALDRPNQIAVQENLREWRFELPAIVKKYEDELTDAIMH